MADTHGVDPQQTARIAAATARDQRAHRLFAVLAGVLAVGMVALAYGVLSLKSYGDQLGDEQAVAAVAAQRLASQVRGLGATPVVTPPAPVTAVTGARGPAGPTGPGPSQEQIDDAVAGYLAVHPPAPGRNATAEQVSAAVAAYLTAHPPAPGRPPSASDIATAVSNYCSTRGGCAGPAGANASSEQIAEAVAAYCGAHNECAGPAGAAGAPGAPGATGQPGPSGATGPPPAGYTIVVPGPAGIGATTETCTRNNTDDSSPTYSCS